MEQHYINQVSMPYFAGPARQRGRGLLTAAAVAGVARTIYPIAKPFFKKYVVPAAKRFGKSFVQNFAPEIKDVVRGKTKLKTSVKRAARKSIKAQVGGGRRLNNNKRKRKTTPSKKKNCSKSSRLLFKNLKE
jgi:hypothetical protein